MCSHLSMTQMCSIAQGRSWTMLEYIYQLHLGHNPALDCNHNYYKCALWYHSLPYQSGKAMACQFRDIWDMCDILNSLNLLFSAMSITYCIILHVLHATKLNGTRHTFLFGQACLLYIHICSHISKDNLLGKYTFQQWVKGSESRQWQ